MLTGYGTGDAYRGTVPVMLKGYGTGDAYGGTVNVI